MGSARCCPSSRASRWMILSRSRRAIRILSRPRPPFRRCECGLPRTSSMICTPRVRRSPAVRACSTVERHRTRTTRPSPTQVRGLPGPVSPIRSSPKMPSSPVKPPMPRLRLPRRRARERPRGPRGSRQLGPLKRQPVLLERACRARELNQRPRRPCGPWLLRLWPSRCSPGPSWRRPSSCSNPHPDQGVDHDRCAVPELHGPDQDDRVRRRGH